MFLIYKVYSNVNRLSQSSNRMPSDATLVEQSKGQMVGRNRVVISRHPSGLVQFECKKSFIPLES